MILLALECSAELSSAAVWKDSEILSHQIVESKFGHAERIITQVEKAVKQASIDFSQIDFFVGGRGPGSFTGIRTCLSAITGFSIASDKAFYGVNCLSALAFANYSKIKKNYNCDHKMKIFAILDTRRGSFYFQEFDKEFTPCDNIYDFSLEQLQKKINIVAKSDHFINVCGPFSEYFWHKNVETEKFFPVKYESLILDATHIANYAAWQLESNIPFSPATPLYLAPAKIFK